MSRCSQGPVLTTVLAAPTVTPPVPSDAGKRRSPNARGLAAPGQVHAGGRRKSLTERDDFSECPLSFRTAKDATLERQPSSRQTPSHLTVWLVFQVGNCEQTRKPSAFVLYGHGVVPAQVVG